MMAYIDDWIFEDQPTEQHYMFTLDYPYSEEEIDQIEASGLFDLDEPYENETIFEFTINLN